MPITDVPTLDAAFGADITAAAEDATERFYARHPDAGDRYGARGRAYSVHDNAYLVAWMRGAVELGSADTLRRNLRWLLDLLVARDFPGDWFIESLDIAADVSVERGLLAAADADATVRPVIDELRVLASPKP